MHKGFAFYSPHETTVFLLKAVLLSFWIGIDLIGALQALTMPASLLLRHGFLFAAIVTLLGAGTLFSILFIWSTGSLFGPHDEPALSARHALAQVLRRIKRDPYRLLASGGAGVAVLLCAVSSYLLVLHKESEGNRELGRADVAIARKCEEVATLERQLFQSDQQLVMAQCLLQYDDNYARKS